MSDHIVYVNDENFDTEVISAKLPVLVDFFATWCGPCRSLAPILSEMADNYVGKVKVVKVDVDQSPEAAQRYGIRGIPTVVFFKDGSVEATHVGAMTKTQLKAFVDSNL